MTNLLIYGDDPASHSGLGRISRDLALITTAMPEFHTATFGRGATCSSRLPFPQYSFPETAQWGESFIQRVWQDFTRGSGDGTILTVWDASRLLWFSGLSSLSDPSLDVFLGPNRTFTKWGYFMVDGTGPDGVTLPYESSVVMKAYDRVLVSSAWGAEVARRSGVDCEWMPHPVDGERFKVAPGRATLNALKHGDGCVTPREAVRELMEVQDRVVVGCCMTNQARKDWPVAFAAASLLAKKYKSRFLFWVHTDSPAFTPGSYWNLHALAHDYGIPPECLRITLTGTYTDSMMAAFYNACDATILCSGGEGFGYPIAESLMCGCPCITQNWAAGAELTLPEWRVPVHVFRLDTSHNILRAVHSPYMWADMVEQVIEKGKSEGEEWREEIAEGVRHLQIQNLKSVWQRWFREGLQ